MLLKRRMLFLTLLMILITACTNTSGPFEDDFSDIKSGWGIKPTGEDENFSYGYADGKYVFNIDVPQFFVWTTKGNTYADVSIEVSAFSEGATDNHFGVVCRYRNDQFYYFAVSADGYYGVFLHNADGTLVPLNKRAMLSSSAVHKNQENTLLAICEGTQLSFYVNGELVTQIEDKTLNRGDVGLAGGTLEQAMTTVYFDNMQVTVPSSE